MKYIFFFNVQYFKYSFLKLIDPLFRKKSDRVHIVTDKAESRSDHFKSIIWRIWKYAFFELLRELDGLGYF